MTEGTAERVRVAIVGSGFGGLGAAIRLKREGIHDLVLLERADDVGGTWRDNVYPGCACDVQSHLYSFSFAPNPDWSRTFSRQPEIQEYLRRVAREHDVLRHVRFGHEVTGAAWDGEARRWRIETSRGAFEAQVLVMASGALSDPSIPDIPGLSSFGGPAFHSSAWDTSFDPRGKRVAVIGTGASAIQLVPEIQPQVERLLLFQRTPPWILPRHDRPIRLGVRRFFRRVPAAQKAVRGLIYAMREAAVPGFRHPKAMAVVQRIARRHLERSVPDPVLRARLTPDFTIGCKRVLLSSDYLPALTRPNVEVVTEGIAEVRPSSVVTADGVERPADAIVLATGFRPTDPPLGPHVRGRGGRTLAEAWAGSPKAYLGSTVAGFPNLFLLLGPNTGLGHTSVVYMIESQIEHLAAALRHLDATGAGALEPREEAQATYVAGVDARMRGTVWTSGGCESWYLDATGRNSTLWPDFTFRFRRRAARLDARDYLTIPAAEDA